MQTVTTHEGEARSKAKYESHEYAELFPMMTPLELEALRPYWRNGISIERAVAAYRLANPGHATA